MNPQNSPTPSASGGMGGGTVTEGGGTLTEAKNKITQTAKEAASKVKSAASTTASRVKEQAERVAAEKKATAAERIGSYSSAIHETASSMEDKDPNIAWFTHQAADKLQGVADYMRSRDFTGFKHDAEDMARRHPAVFFGGMFLAGLVIGNIVKASRRKLDETDYSSGYDTDWSSPTSGEMSQPTLTDSERASAGI